MSADPVSDLKQRLRPALEAELLRVRRGRAARRRAWGSGALLVILCAAAWLAFPRAAPRTPPPSTPHADARMIPTDPAVLARWRIETSAESLAAARVTGPSAITIERIEDAQLLDYFASVGTPTGLARFEGTARLTAAAANSLFKQPG